MNKDEQDDPIVFRTYYDHESGESWEPGMSTYEPTVQDHLLTIAFGFALVTCILGALMAFGVTDQKWFVAGCASTVVMYLYAFLVPRFVK